MDQLKPIARSEGFTEQIIAMKIDDELVFDSYYESTIRVLCSSRHKSRPNRPLVRFPKRKYTVTKSEDKETVTVKREA